MIKKVITNISQFIYKEHQLHCRNGLSVKVFLNRFTLLKDTMDLADIINECDYNLGSSMAHEEECANWARYWKNKCND